MWDIVGVFFASYWSIDRFSEDTENISPRFGELEEEISPKEGRGMKKRKKLVAGGP